ncbi:MAG: hypothetical protein ABIQ93_00570, partial [Saprospiraceae bacterium]
VTLGANYPLMFNGQQYRLEVARLHPDGMLDDSFGNAGRLLIPVNGYHALAGQIRKYANGDFLIMATLTSFDVVSHAIALIRFTADGNIDPTFGPDGTGILVKPIDMDWPFPAWWQAIFRIAPDGKIVVAGTYMDKFCVYRYNPDGSDDTTFGINGHTVIPVQAHAGAYDMAVQPDGKILTVGVSTPQNTTYYITLTRQNTDGTLDSSFANDGIVTYLKDGSGGAYRVALQEDGKAVVICAAASGMLVGRFLHNGQLDVDFGTNGFVKPGLVQETGAGQEIMIDDQHAIYVAGTTTDQFQNSFWTVLKYRPGFYTPTKDLPAPQLAARVLPNFSSPGEPFLLRYQLPQRSSVSAQLLNTYGQVAQVFFSEENQTSGEQTHSLRWNPELSAGFYFLHLKTENSQRTLPILLHPIGYHR